MTWCSDCGEDVLLVASPQDRFADTCIQCQKTIRIHRPEQPVGPLLGNASQWTRPVELRGTLAGAPLAISEQPNIRREDSTHARRLELESFERHFEEAIDPKAGRHSTILVWFALMLGLAALTFGGVLIGWSIAKGQTELLRIGVPAGIGGLISFLVGLALQADMNGHFLRRIGHIATGSGFGAKPDVAASRLDLLTRDTRPDPAKAMLDLKHRLNEFGSEIRHAE